MASDLQLTDDAVIVVGNLAVGTDAPQRPIHAETGEIHSGGGAGGFSFANRTKGAANFFPESSAGDRWVLYSQDNFAHLWTSGVLGGNLFSVSSVGQAFITGITGGLSFGDRSLAGKFVENPTKGERWTWYAKDGVAHLRSGDDRISIQANGFVSIGIAKAERPLHVHGDEIHSSGTGAGFSFGDRSAKPFVGSPKKGERWVWYSSQGSARLWSGADKLAISPKGEVTIGSGVFGKPYTTITPGKIVLGTGKMIHGEAPAPGQPNLSFDLPEEFDLLHMLKDLRAELDQLKAEVAKLKGKP